MKIRSQRKHQRYMDMYLCLEADVYQGIICPECSAPAVSVWFTKPAKDKCAVWFLCERCDMWSHGNVVGVPEWFREERIHPKLQALDEQIEAEWQACRANAEGEAPA